jgi:2-oxoisovalerate dehydrogenase E1 component
MAKTLKAARKHRGVSADEAIEDFRLACVSRALDDREIALQRQSKAFFQISGAGHEALYLGLARNLRPGYDWFFPYYRDGSLMLGLGVAPKDLLLQAVGSADDPASGGRQMPCHWSFPELNVVTQSSATGSQCIPAVGCAEAARYIVRRDLPGCTAYGDELTYISLGEGACSQGEFWESLNTACTLHLPVLFVVADNGYAISVPADDQHPAPIAELVAGFRGLAIHKMDGRDYFEVRRKGKQAIERVRAGEGPGLIHAIVTRPYSHSLSDDQRKYRTPEELAEEQEYDPIDQLERELVEADILTQDAAAQIRRQAKEVITAAAAEAIDAPRPDPTTVLDHVTGPLPDVTEPDEVGSDGEVVTYGEAIRLTLHELMERDERIRVFGEDVADAATDEVLDSVPGKGGVFGITHGLQRKFGKARCFNSPLAEANIIGRAVGQGIRGLRPSPEIQFFDYIWTAMQQLRTEAATTRWRSNGRWSAPMVARVPIGGYLQGGAIWHSQSGESIFTHTPGLFVVMPSRARDAAGMLRTAFDCEDPVLFLEHKHLYRQMYNRDPFPPPDYKIPFGKGTYVTRGDDVTIVTYGATVQRSVQAARDLEKADGLSVEIVDLRSLAPWDSEIVAESAAKTSRVLVVHEDIEAFGFGAEVAAWVAEHCFFDLDAPVMRVGAKMSFVAYEPTLEDAILPQTSDITEALRTLAAT